MKNICIKGPLKYWKETFTYSKYINISGRNDLNDHDFKYLDNVEYINMPLCKQKNLTDNVFYHLLNIKDLNLQGCCGHWISGHHFTDKLFNHLSNLERLYIDDNHVITNTGIEKLKKNKRFIYS